jgi:hypothetical protein
VAYKVSQLSLSQENMIFHFLHLDIGEGIFLAPLSPAVSQLHVEVLSQFRAACHIIHANFQMAIYSREALKAGGMAKTWVNKNLVAIKEQVSHIRGQSYKTFYALGQIYKCILKCDTLFN